MREQTRVADVAYLRLFAFQEQGRWSASVHDLEKHQRVKSKVPVANTEDGAKGEALTLAAEYLGKLPNELEKPVWRNS